MSEPEAGVYIVRFKVTASGASSDAPAVSVDYTTSDITAVAGADYNYESGTLDFSSLDSEIEICIEVRADNVYLEGDEFFEVLLSGVTTGAEISGGVGTGKILDRTNPDGELSLKLGRTTYVCACNCCGEVPVDTAQGRQFVPTRPFQPAYRADGATGSNGVINVAAQFDPNRELNSAEVSVKIDGTWFGPVSYYGEDSEIDDWLVFTQQVDLSSFAASGGYPLEIKVKANYADGTTTRSKSGYTYILDKESESGFGERWHLTDVSRLVVTDSGAHQGAALLHGDGLAYWYPESGSDYLTPEGTFGELTAEGTGYALTQPNGAVDHFDLNGLLVKRTDENLNSTIFEYIDADGDSKADEISQITDPFHRTTKYEYDNVTGELETVTDYAGRETKYTYTNGLISKIEHPDPDGGSPSYPTETFSYDAVSGRLTEYKDALSRVTEYEYDVGGRIETITLPDSTTREIVSVATKGLKTGATGKLQNALHEEQLFGVMTDGRGNSTDVYTDDFGNEIKRVDSEGNTVITERDVNGLPIVITQKGGGGDSDRVTRLFYNSDGYLVGKVLPDLSRQAWEYDSHNKTLSRFTDELGRTTDYEYDALGNVTNETRYLAGQSLEPNSPATPNEPQRSLYNVLDVDSNFRIDAFDMIIMINWFNLNDWKDSVVSGPAMDEFNRDINGDGHINTWDYITLINYNHAPDPAVVTSFVYTSPDDAGDLANLPNGLLLTMTDALGRVTQYTYETNKSDPAFGRLLSVTEAYGLDEEATTSYEYDIAGNVTAVVNPLGVPTKFDYDNLDRKIKMTEAHPTNPALEGAVTEYEYDAVGNMTKMTDPSLYVTLYEYDARDRLEKVTQPIPVGANPLDAPVSLYTYDGNGNVASFSDPLEYVTLYEYDEADRLVLTKYPNQTQEELVYNRFGEVVERTAIGYGIGSGSSTTQYDYDLRGRLVSTTLPATDKVSGSKLDDLSVYDAAGQLISYTDRQGTKTNYKYDSFGRVASITSPEPISGAGRPILRIAYDLVGNVVAEIDALGNFTERRYDGLNRTVQVIEMDPDGSGNQTPGVTNFTYDDAGQLILVQSPRNQYTEYIYDRIGRNTQVTEAYGTALSAVSQFIYDEAGDLVQTKDPLGRVVSMGYDRLHRQLDRVGDTDEEAYAYDKAGNLLTFTDGLSRVTKYEYDSMGRVTSILYPAPGGGATQPEITYAYQDLGTSSTITSEDNDNDGLVQTFNAWGWLIEEDREGSVTSYEYDLNGNLLHATDPMGRVTSYDYDKLDRQIKVIAPDPDGSGGVDASETAYEYDLAGNLLKVIDPLGNETTYTFDSRYRQMSSKDALGGETSFTYDAVGNLLTLTDPVGNQTAWEYDIRDRVTEETNELGKSREFEYDKVGNLLGKKDRLGRLTTYAYDDMNRVVSERWWGTAPAIINSSLYSERLYYDEYQGGIGYSTMGTITAGSFTLTFDGQTTAPIAWDASDLDILSALEDLSNLAPGDIVTVYSSAGASYRDMSFTFGGSLSGINVPQITVDATGIYDGYGGASSYPGSSMDGYSWGETQEIPDHNAGGWTGGTFTLTFDGQTTVPIAWNASSNDVEAALEALSNIDDVSVTGGMSSYMITFAGALASIDVDPITVDGSALVVPGFDPFPSITNTHISDNSHWDEYQGGIGFLTTDPIISGTFTLTFDGQTTAPIAWDASDMDIQEALEDLSNIEPGDVTVSGMRGSSIVDLSFQFGGNLSGIDLPMIEADPSGIYDGYGPATALTGGAMEGYAYGEVQEVTDYLVGSWSGGTFTLSFEGQTTAPIAWNASNYDVESALEALSNIVDVSVTTGTNGYQITFNGALALRDVGAVTGDASNLLSANAVNTLAFEYDDAGQLVYAGDQFGEYEYDYDGMGRLKEETQNLAGLPEVIFGSAYNVKSGRTSLSATVGGTDDFLRTYTRDEWNRVTELLDAGQVGGNGVVRKEVDFAYNAAHQHESIERKEGASPTTIATTSFTYDGMGRLNDLWHKHSSTTLARYQYDYDLASRIQQISSYVDGVSHYDYDDTNQLVGADHDGSGPPDEDYEYDANGNRNSSGFDVDSNNQIVTDGTYSYTYDGEGNRASKTLISTGEKEEYAWDHRNRLVSITFKDGSGNIVKTVGQTYDVWNQWIKRSVDADGAGADGDVDTYFAYESGQITFQWEDSDGAGGSAPTMSHRYTWAEGVDQFLADEQISTPGTAGNVLWGLGDHLGSLRDIADLVVSTVSVTNHRDYDTFGSLTSETNSAVDLLYGYTSKPWDDASGLQNNLNRWLDVWLKQWMSEDPIGFAAGDENLYRYVGNAVTTTIDPIGLAGTPSIHNLDVGGTGSGGRGGGRPTGGLGGSGGTGGLSGGRPTGGIGGGGTGTGGIGAGRPTGGIGAGRGPASGATVKPAGAQSPGAAKPPAAKPPTVKQPATKPQPSKPSTSKPSVTQYKKRKPGLTEKEASKDCPSWAKGQPPKVGEDGKTFAKRLCEGKYGPGNYAKGAGSEFSKIQKYGDRAFE
ncbi:RHS repeat-associated core domain-containing protein [Anatilimnocola floriformis]|uniref:RHS repeat-associated core domain-containing protein n=1 Tax=Anatilimnocola floriformis TaxID=2948575 RepID=UPI0020C43B98|nr:RHS repeat-associated core domain-containing protein [Anatilimnocola floriformis]